MLEKNYWETRWQQGQTGWDLRQPSPPLCEFAQKCPPGKRNLKILIPGCGNGHEAIFLLKNDFSDLTMLDFAPSAIENLRQVLNGSFSGERNWHSKISLVCEDFFKHEGQYDLILEQTFFCALHPSLREKYAEKMLGLLNPGGVLAGVLFNMEFEGGPPFGGSADEYRGLFSRFFGSVEIFPCQNSVAPRMGNEVFFTCSNL